MTVYRIGWSDAATDGARVLYGALIAGLPYLIVGDGVTVSTVVWTDDADPAWHVGTSPTTKPWLATDALMIEERIRPLDGGIDVSSVMLRLADIDLGVTAALGAREGMASSTLADGISATSTTVLVRSVASLPSSGVLHIGRERITYSAKATGPARLTGCVRGTAGTKARRHQVLQGQAPPRVYATATGTDALPSTLGRRVTLWAMRVTGAGEVTDPTLIYDGRVGPGTRMSDGGATWEIPVDHASKALAEKTRPTEMYLYGYSHFCTERRTSNNANNNSSLADTPLYAEWRATNAGGYLTFLTDAAGDPDHDGWSPSADEFVARWNRAAAALGSGIVAANDTTGFSVRASASPGRRLVVGQRWRGPNSAPGDPVGTGDVALSARINFFSPPPEANIWLSRKLHLDSADIAAIPAAPTGVDSDRISFQWGLDVERDNELLPKERVRVTFGAASGNVVEINTPFVRGVRLAGENAGTRAFGGELLLTKPTSAPLRCLVQTRTARVGWWEAVRAIITGIDEARGLDHLDDSLSWDRIGSLAAGAQPWNWERLYWHAPEDPPIERLRDEAALSGLMLCTWRGRISVAKVRDPSTTEAVTRTITQADLRRGQHPTMREVSDGIISSVRLIFPPHDAERPSFLRVIDATAMSESGAGGEIVARVAEGAVRIGTDPRTSPDVRTTVENIALNLLSPWTRPYRLVTIPTDLRCAGLEVGDVIELEEWLLPSGTGTRGISGRGVVVGHRKDYTAGRVDIMLRVSPVRAGWAPAYAVDSIAGAVVTLDDPYPESASGFATDYTSTGARREDLGLEYLAAGDKLRLVEVGNRSPATPLSVEVSAIDASLRQITLTASPGVSWETLATGAYGKVLLIPETHGASLTRQRRYVYVADGTTVTLGTGDPARTWA